VTAPDSGRIHVLELRSVRGTGGGPEKTILLGTAQTSRDAFAVTVCYIRDQRDEVFGIDAWAREVGIDYVEVRERHSFDHTIGRQLRTIVRDRRIDIVHAHEYKTDLLALWLARAEGVTPLATAHGWTGHSWKERRLYYPADRWLLARFPRVIAVSGEIRRTLIAAGASPERVTTVLNAIDPQRFVRDRGQETGVRASLGLPAGAFVLGAVGRAEPQKRFDLLVDVFAEFAVGRPNLHLVIAGDGSTMTPLRQQVADLGDPGHRVHVLGHRTDVDLLHHAFDVFVQTSDYEGTPNAVLEAMALESPIVATRAGGTAEVALADEHALLVECGDRRALVAAIGRLHDDAALRRGLAAAARQRVVTELSFARRVAKVESVYKDLMMERARARGAGR
jgi:glycosyltransferase involved in cell wall biosynthesis